MLVIVQYVWHSSTMAKKSYLINRLLICSTTRDQFTITTQETSGMQVSK